MWLQDVTKKVGVAKKISSKWKGPYKVVEVLNERNVVIIPDDDMNFGKRKLKKKHILTHVNRLKLCYSRNLKHISKVSELMDTTVVIPSTDSNLKKKSKKRVPNTKTVQQPIVEVGVVDLTVQESNEVSQQLEFDDEEVVVRNEFEEDWFSQQNSESVTQFINEINGLGEEETSNGDDSKHSVFELNNYFKTKLKNSSDDVEPVSSRLRPLKNVNYKL